MTGRGQLGALALLAGLLGVLGASSARAQTPATDDPLAEVDFAQLRALESEAAEPGEELPTAVLIRESQAARAACNPLVDRINALVDLWRRVRAGELDRETFGVELARAEDDWEGLRARCRIAKDDLEETQQRSLTVNTLDWEREQLERLWRALVAVCRTWVDERPRADIDVAAKTFSGRLAAYASWLDLHAAFWDGSLLRPEQEPTCVDDTRRIADELASGIRKEMVVPPTDRTPTAVQELNLLRNGLAKALGRCEADPLTDLQRVELKVLAQKATAYGKAIAGLEAGDSAELQAAMDREQELTGRLLRCRREHATDAVSATCAPK